MSKIHRPPRGLQHLLGSQSFGQNPDELAQNVQPTLDMTGFYSAELLKTATKNTMMSGEGVVGQIKFTAPVALVAAGIEMGPLTGTDTRVSFDIRVSDLGGVGFSTVVGSQPCVQYPTGATPSFGMMFSPYLVVPGGCEVQGFLTAYTGALLGGTFRVLYVDLNPIADVL
jgi:hypothetical protein